MRLFHSPRTSAGALLALLASTTVALTGCGRDAGSNGAENDATENVQVPLPPSIKASHPYRCEDNSVVTIDFLSDNMTINLRREGTVSQLKSPAPGEAFTDGNYTVSGDGAAIELTRPGKEPQTCKM
ncbi:hypothetical protein [Sphingobium aquiterrae]|uniref:hypothetical protein n=1 Tax=Sphingobium aquiterrae TaxID=2038656 RepID=UPI00301B270C